MPEEIPNGRFRIDRRDYSNQIIRSPAPTPHKIPRVPKKPRRRKKFLLFLVALIVCGTASVAVFLLTRAKPYDLLQKDLKTTQAAVNFPLYIPNKMPTGFSYKSGSVSLSNGVVIYHLDSGNNQSLFVSGQAKPKGVDFNDFYTRVLQNKADAFSTEGKAAVGVLNGQVAGSLVTDKVWVLMNAKSGIDGQTISQILSSLRPLH